MKSTPATGLDSIVEGSGKHFDVIRHNNKAAAASIERNVQVFAAGVEARKTEGRQLNRRNSRSLHQHNSYVAHIERYALDA
jgi:hypothetical protein